MFTVRMVPALATPLVQQLAATLVGLIGSLVVRASCDEQSADDHNGRDQEPPEHRYGSHSDGPAVKKSPEGDDCDPAHC